MKWESSKDFVVVDQKFLLYTFLLYIKNIFVDFDKETHHNENTSDVLYEFYGDFESIKEKWKKIRRYSIKIKG